MPNDALVVTSAAFAPGGRMPVRYTGYGEDISPPLHVAGIPPRAKSLAIVMVDLDVPLTREYPHWLIWNLPARADIPGGIPAGAQPAALEGARQGVAYGRHVYRGPKPPRFIRRRHRYAFTVYALDTLLALDAGVGKKPLLAAMQGHVLAQGSLTGVYRNGQ